MTINGGFVLNGNQSFQNLAGSSLEMCSNAPLTGYFRNGISILIHLTMYSIDII